MILFRLVLMLVVYATAVLPLAAKDGLDILHDRIKFPETEVGSETTLTVTVRNIDDENRGATITRVELDSGPGEPFIVGALPQGNIPPGGTATFTVTFRPLSPGEFNTEYYLWFTIQGESAEEKTSFHLDGHSRPEPPRRPRIQVFPRKVNFGTVATMTLHTANVVVSNTTGTAPAVFRGVAFPSGNTAFTFIEPDPPVQIGAGQQIRLRFGFQPTGEGYYRTEALIRTSDRDIPIQLEGSFGDGPSEPRPNIEVFPDILNFGTVTTASVFTGVITVSNTTGTADATLAGVQISDPAFVLERSGPVVVTAGTQIQLPITFRPQTEDAYETVATLQTTDGEFFVRLLGVLDFPDVVDPVLTASIAVPEITANVGEQFSLPLTIEDISGDAAALVASCRVVLRFNSTLLVPRMDIAGVDSISEGMRTVALESDIAAPSVGAPLFSVPMTAALGDAEATTIDILGMDWFDAAGAPLDVETETTGGRLTIGDIWRYGGVRLVNSNAGALAMEILPNPVVDRATFRMSYQSASTLVIYDITGNVVLSLTGMLPAPGPNPVTLQADMDQLSAGTYYCRLSSGKFSLVRTMRIE